MACAARRESPLNLERSPGGFSRWDFVARGGPALLLLLSLTWHPSAAAAVETKDGKPSCRGRSDRVGPCYSVRGRRRILGVIDADCVPEGCRLPAQIASKLSWDTDLFGEFVVCPFTEDKNGAMRMVCVDSGTHLEVRTRDRAKR